MTSDFIAACLGQPVQSVPVWFMRQAGRSLPEYRRAREGLGMLETCRRPELVAEITMQPVQRHGVDAGILFSDIVVPLAAAGIDVDIIPGVGPVVASPLRSESHVAAVRSSEPGQMSYVAEAVRLVRQALGETPLIGFAGAPFTLASYLIEGAPSRTHSETKAFMHGEPALWHSLCDWLSDISLHFLRVQADAGVQAIQLFDSWAGTLSEADYREYVLPYSRRIFSALEEYGIPRIHFGVGTGHLLPVMAEAGADVVGVDWRLPLDEASKILSGQFTLQGNLDPATLLAPPPVVEREVQRVLNEGRLAPSHIFNLGHGVLPQTDPGVLTHIVDLVHASEV